MPSADSLPRETAERIDELRDAVETLASQVEVLRNVLDEIREDFSWALRNTQSLSPPAPFILKSMAKDPAAPDWAARLNRMPSASAGDQSASSGDPPSPSADDLTERLIENVELVINHIATEQLELMLVAINQLRTDLLAAIRDGRSRQQPLPTPDDHVHVAGPVVPPPVLPSSPDFRSASTDVSSRGTEPSRQKSLWIDEK